MHELVAAYLPLVDFLADCLGENTEVVLHDLSDWHRSVVAIRNVHISGREICSPVTDLELKIFKTTEFDERPHLANYHGVAKNGNPLRSSTLFIRDKGGEPVGMLCINSDCHSLLQARDALAAFIAGIGLHADASITESFHMSVEELVRSNLRRVCPQIELRIDTLSQKEKLEIVEGLDELGTFLVKGAIVYAAESLNVSVPTLYRYLNTIRK